MGIFGDLNRTETTGPPKSTAEGNDKRVETAEGAEGKDKRVGDLPPKITKERVQAESGKAPNTEAVGAPGRPSSFPVPSSTKEPNQQPLGVSAAITPTGGDDKPSSTREANQQLNERDTRHGRLDDLRLRNNEQPPSEEEWISRNMRANWAATQPAESKSVSSEWVRKAAGEAPEISDTRAKQPPRSAAGLWAAVVVLALALAGLAGYGYLTIRQNGMTFSQLPGLEQLGGALQSRLSVTEAKLQDLTSNWASLSQQVAAMNSKVRSGLETSRRHAEELIMQEQERIEAEMAKRDQVVNVRLARVESQQQAENERLTQVQDWAQKNLDNVRQEMAAEREDRGHDMTALRQDVGQSRSDLQNLAQKVERQRVDFELVKNKQQELVPGVSLTVTRTDARYQRFEGYLELLEDSRTLWLSKVGAQQAVPFYFKQGGQPYDLVVTTVKRDGVVGYLLVPEDKSQGTSATASGAPASAGTQRPSGSSF